MGPLCWFGALRRQQLRLREMEALEQVDAERFGLRELLRRLDLLRDELGRVWPEQLYDLRHQQGINTFEIDLHHVDCRQQLVETTEIPYEIVQRHSVAVPPQLVAALDRRFIDQHDRNIVFDWIHAVARGTFEGGAVFHEPYRRFTVRARENF